MYFSVQVESSCEFGIELSGFMKCWGNWDIEARNLIEEQLKLGALMACLKRDGSHSCTGNGGSIFIRNIPTQ
jgi:hypothetical protein